MKISAFMTGEFEAVAAEATIEGAALQRDGTRESGATTSLRTPAESEAR